MDFEGNKYCVLVIDWDYDNKRFNISMPTYIPKSLKCFLHPAPKIPAIHTTHGQFHNMAKALSMQKYHTHKG